jgi:hypothetical protein
MPAPVRPGSNSDGCSPPQTERQPDVLPGTTAPNGVPAGEASLVLSASALTRAGALVPGERVGGLWGWTYEGEDRPHAIVSYEADLNRELRTGRLHGAAGDHAAELRRRRWWFVCPLLGCRAAKLYLPPGAKLFGSREAYGLTYAFCQASGSPLIASIAADVGASVPRVRRAMRTLGFLGGRPRTGAPVRYAQAGRASPG